MGGMNKHNGAYYWCKRCLGHFEREQTFLRHQQHCTTNDVSTTIMTMPPEGMTLKFKSVTNQQDMPFVVFADFECIVERIDRQSSAHPHIYQQHRPISVGWKLVSLLDDFPQEPYMEVSGDHVVHQFLLHMQQLQERLMKELTRNERLKMTDEDVHQYNIASVCHISQRHLDADKVRDHEH